VTRVALLCALMATGAMVACGAGQPRSQSARDDGGIVAPLCEARGQAVHDAAEAKAIFVDRAHDGLHELARDVAELDRSAAARLLEAKQAVEAEIERPSGGTALAEHLEALIASTRRALEATNQPVSGCAQGGNDG
jgi:hypothetical protein